MATNSRRPRVSEGGLDFEYARCRRGDSNDSNGSDDVICFPLLKDRNQSQIDHSCGDMAHPSRYTSLPRFPQIERHLHTQPEPCLYPQGSL